VPILELLVEKLHIYLIIRLIYFIWSKGKILVVGEGVYYPEVKASFLKFLVLTLGTTLVHYAKDYV
jgi:hypothetical protein